MGEEKEGGVPRTRGLGFSMHRKMRRVLIGHRDFFFLRGRGKDFLVKEVLKRREVLTNKRGRVLKKEGRKKGKKRKKEKGWVEQGKFLKEKLTENHGGRLGCSMNILVSLKEQTGSVENKVF